MIAIPLALTVFDVDLATDLSATLSFAAVTVLLELEKSDWNGSSPCGGPCDEARRRELNDVDRWVTENGSGSARLASDLLLDAMLLFPLVGLTQDSPDVLVGYEALAATALATEVLKFGVQRPRPLAYNSAFKAEDRLAGDARLSFPSGHSSLAFASATAFVVPWIDRHHGVSSFAGATAAYAVASIVAALRVAGGKHFVTDVLAGAALGIAIGLAVTFSHRTGDAAGVGSGQDMSAR